MAQSRGISTADDLGLGDTLGMQRMDETEEEKRRRRLGLSSLSSQSPSAMALYPALGGMGSGGISGRGY